MDSFILGYGMVGQATAKALGITKHFSHKKNNMTLEEAKDMKYCIICLPTPTDEKGSQEKGINCIKDYINQIKQYNKDIIFVVRSTVIPGTCRTLAKETKARVVSCPEFLSEDTAEEDALRPRMKIMGADNEKDQTDLVELFKPIKSKIEMVCDTVTSETIKYTFNVFAAVKVVFANQIYDDCQKSGANYEIIRECLFLHPWGSKHHLRVLHKGGRGAGGHCIPKDLKAYAKYTGSKLFKVIDDLNDKYLTESKKQ